MTMFHGKIRKKKLYEVKRTWYVQINKETHKTDFGQLNFGTICCDL